MTTDVVSEEVKPQSPAPATEIDHHPEVEMAVYENAEPKSHVSSDEIRGMMEVIAATGKFWHDWDMLKALLSIWLKQVLSEYPEAKVDSADGPQPNTLFGETYPQLVSRLDNALLSFVEGPPFTLQRLCEILLSPKSTYSTLSKLALALEKNLLVTSTLTICSDPYPASLIPKPAEPENKIDEVQVHTDLVPNGVENAAEDVDEEMVEAEIDEDAPIAETMSDPQNIDTDMQVEPVKEAPEVNLDSSDSSPPKETCSSEEKTTESGSGDV